MIVGRFGDTTGAPYVEARVLFPRLKVAIKLPSPGEADVSFLADTGADRTTIMPADLTRFLLSHDKLENETEVYGVSGKGIAYVESAIVSIAESNLDLRVYTLDVMIMKPTPFIAQAPSLLGRDIMQNWVMTFDKPANRFVARVVRSDHTFKAQRGASLLPPLSGIQPPILRP